MRLQIANLLILIIHLARIVHSCLADLAVSAARSRAVLAHRQVSPPQDSKSPLEANRYRDTRSKRR